MDASVCTIPKDSPKDEAERRRRTAVAAVIISLRATWSSELLLVEQLDGFLDNVWLGQSAHDFHKTFNIMSSSTIFTILSDLDYSDYNCSDTDLLSLNTFDKLP